MRLSNIALAITAIYGGFSPANLFTGGVAGAWYDPSDLSTLFDSSTGTTPVSMPGQGAAVPVGLMLDKSQGLVLGSNLLVGNNADFSTGVGNWAGNRDGTITAASGVGVLTTSTTITFSGAVLTSPNSGLVVGRYVEISFSHRLVSGTGATLENRGAITLGNSAGFFTPTASWSVFTQRGVVASSTLQIANGATANQSVYEFDNISVRELPGNHAVSINNTTARPELRARVNLLTYSEEFDNGVWSKLNFLAFGSGSVVNATTAPNGTITADLLVPNTTAAAEHYVDVGPSTVVVSGTTYTLSWSAKAAGYKWLRLAFNSAIAPANERAAWFDVETGAVGTVQSNVTASIQSQGDGWYRCSISRSVTTSTTTTFGFASITNADQGLGFTANGTSGMYWWGADLRPANIGANVPAYQRIADADTYDTNGFPLYLRFDGLDDGMYTPANLNLSATDKVGVFAGVRKNADTTGGIAELSATIASNNGAFACFAPQGTGTPGYFFRSKGTLTGTAEVTVGYAAPITNIFTGVGDISGDSAILRLNGTQVASDSANQGTGNYGTYPLYIGSRNNGSFFFNGHLHGLIIAGSAVSAGNISATESWMAGKTGIQI